MVQVTDPLSSIRWLSASNAGAQEIPGFGLVRITGATSAGIFTVDRPNADSQDVWVNGPVPIPVGGVGQITCDWPAHALYESGDGTPAVDETWGAGNGTYKLRKNKSGFVIRSAGTGGTTLIRPPLVTAVTGTMEIKEVDGTPDYSSIVTLSFDQADGFVVSQPGAGQARVDIAAATATQAGVVSTTTQAFAGNKTLNGDLIFTHAAGNYIYLDATGGDSSRIYTGIGGSFKWEGTPMSFNCGVTSHIFRIEDTTAATQIAYAITDSTGSYTGGTGTVSGLVFHGGLYISGSVSGSGITSLNGLSGSSQTFVNDTNVTITSSGTTHTLGWSGTLAVSRGGSGAGTFTAHGVLLGEGTSAFVATAAMTDGQLLVGQTGADPLPKTISGDVTVAASGAVTIANNAVTTAKINAAAVTLAKIQNAAASSKLLGSGASGSGASYVEITIGSGLTMTGTTLSASGGGGSPAGSDTQVQYNNSGSFGASANFTFDSVSTTLTVTNGASVTAKLSDGRAFHGEDGTNTVYLCNGSYAIETTGPMRLQGHLATDQCTTGSFTTLGNIVAKMPIYDAGNSLVGYLPIYDSIT